MTSSLLQFLNDLNGEDIAVLSARIDDLSRISKDAKLEAQLLMEVRHSLNRWLRAKSGAADTAPDGEPKRKSAKAVKHQQRVEPAVDETDVDGGVAELRDRVFTLLKAEGSLPVPAIAAFLRVDPARVGRALLGCDWFERLNGEVRVAMARNHETRVLSASGECSH